MSSGEEENRPQAEGESYPPEADAEHGEHVDPDDLLWSGVPHKKKKRKKRKPMPGETIGHLNLTPMMDIMTMLLVFLVMSFATEPSNINVSLEMRPPESSTKKTMEPATKVTISKVAIFVDDAEVAAVDKIDLTGQVSIPEVKNALIERREHLKALEARGMGDEFDGKLLVVADASTRYELVTAVLVTAGEAQFAEYKLVLMQKGDGAAAGSH